MSRMSRQDEDLGQFNQSGVFLQPVCFNTKSVPPLSKHNHPQSTNLGIYDSIKLSQLLQQKTGQVIQFISFDQHSHNTFVSNEALSLLERYSTDELCFVTVVGSKGAGKSFFCDKVLNLSEIRGNHFCRKKNKGINIWSTPFQKDDLKIFLLEINNCNIASQEFKILSTYALMISSSFVVIEPLKANEKSSIQQLDEVMCDVVDKITMSRIKKGEEARTNHQICIPKIFYNLYRSTFRKNQHLNMINYCAYQQLPDALEKDYKGSSEDLIHLPFMDTKCIKEQYIRRTAFIFKELYSKLSEKKYKELVLNGNITSKIIKYIETYLNNKYQLNIQDLYEKIVEDLYQSAYNYCILSYHEQMQKQFEDERPKSFQQLLEIFQRISENTLIKFQEFNLDQKLYDLYEAKLQQHINTKEKMIMEINSKKTQQHLYQFYDQNQIGNVQYYKGLIEKINKDGKELNHGKAEVMGKINSSFYSQIKKSNNIDYKIMKEIEALKDNISQRQNEFKEIQKSKQEKLKTQSKFNKDQEEYLSIDHQLQNTIKKLKNQITQTKNSAIFDPSKTKEEQTSLISTIAANKKKIDEFKTLGKDQRVTVAENKLQQLRTKINMQETLLKELNQSLKTDSPKKQSKKLPQPPKKAPPPPSKKS